MPAPLQQSDIIFSSASHVLRDTLGELKKANLSIKNRLKSIKQDSIFVCAVSDAYHLPLVANERCGSWYIPPSRKAGSAYFKSTDGHFGQWTLSLRRLNLQVLDCLGQHGGVVIVDSTRRGKSMPDALSKTIPIWVAVLNRLLFVEDQEAGELRTPLDVVGESEHAQIESRIDECLHGLTRLDLDLDGLRAKLKGKPMQVCWQRPGDALPEDLSKDATANLIVLCTASNQTSNETSATSDYVQGAADDPEAWSCGLDSVSFWRHSEALLAASEDDLPLLIKELMASADTVGPANRPVLVKPTSQIWISSNDTANSSCDEFDYVIACTTTPDQDLVTNLKDRYIVLPLPAGKNGSRMLRTELSKLDSFRISLSATSKILVTCSTGKDLAIGAALALLCTCFDHDGKLISPTDSVQPSINKTLIKQRLSWIMVSMPDANPSRATLQSVNSYLMG